MTALSDALTQLTQAGASPGSLTTQGLTVPEHVLSAMLSDIWVRPDVAILGFGLAYDLTRLHCSYPHLPCCGGAGRVVGSSVPGVPAATLGMQAFEAPTPPPLRTHVDVLALARLCSRPLAATQRVSLSRVCQRMLGRPLDKSQQCSRWSSRPLSPEQLRYAACDAHVLTAVFDKCLQVGLKPPSRGWKWLAANVGVHRSAFADESQAAPPPRHAFTRWATQRWGQHQRRCASR